MQALSTAVPGKWYTIKWMFGVPEVLEKLKAMEAKHIEHNANALWKGLDKFKDN